MKTRTKPIVCPQTAGTDRLSKARIVAWATLFLACLTSGDAASGANPAQTAGPDVPATAASPSPQISAANPEPASAEEALAQARKLRQEGKRDEALKAFERATQLQPRDETALMDQFRLSAEMNRPTDALKVLDKLIALNPNDMERLLRKAMFAAEAGRPEEALTASEKMTQLRPNDTSSWLLKGQCLAGLNRGEEALQAVDKALTLDPMNDDAWRTRIALEPNLKEFDSSIASDSKLVGKYPKCLGAVYDRAGLYALKGDKAKALADLESAVALKSTDVKAAARQDQRFKSLWNDPDFKLVTGAIPISSGGARAAGKVTLKVVEVDSEETAGEDGKGVNAVDGNPETKWHTQWKDANPAPPHEIVVQLTPPCKIKGFIYLPRQDGQENGTIKDYEFFVSNDGKDFGPPVKKGTFERGQEMKSVTFEAKTCRFIKLRALSEINNQPWTSVAEIDVISD